MGNTTTLPDFPAEEANAIAARVMRVFTPILVSEFTTAVVQDAERAAAGLTTPPPSLGPGTGTSVGSATRSAGSRKRSPSVSAAVGTTAGVGSAAGGVVLAMGAAAAGVKGSRFSTRLQHRRASRLTSDMPAQDALWGTLPYQLRAPHVPHDRPIQEGWLTKRGDFRMRWKRRYFVATNRHHNFMVYYFDKEESKGDFSKAKGRMLLCGYRAKDAHDEEGRREAGQYGLVVYPNDRRRVWFLRCDSVEDRRRWKSTFKLCSMGAEAPLSQRRALRLAFTGAFQRTRWRLGEFDNHRFDRAEPELLCALAVRLAERDVMPAVYEKVTPGPSADKDHNELGCILDEGMALQIDSAWAACEAAIAAHVPVMRAHIAKNLPLIMATRRDVRAVVEDTLLKDVVRPHLASVNGPEVEAAALVIMHALHKAYRELVKLFYNKTKEIIDCGLKIQELRSLHRDMQVYWGPLYPAFVKIRELTRDTARAAANSRVPPAAVRAALADLSMRDVEHMCLSGVRMSMDAALTTFLHRVANAAHKSATHRARASDIDSALADTTLRLVHDCRLRAIDTLKTVMTMALLPGVRRTMEKRMLSSMELVARRTQHIPEAMVPFVDAEGVAFDVAEDAVQAFVADKLVPLASPVLLRLGKLPAKLGVSDTLLSANASSSSGAGTGRGERSRVESDVTNVSWSTTVSPHLSVGPQVARHRHHSSFLGLAASRADEVADLTVTHPAATESAR